MCTHNDEAYFFLYELSNSVQAERLQFGMFEEKRCKSPHITECIGTVVLPPLLASRIALTIDLVILPLCSTVRRMLELFLSVVRRESRSRGMLIL